MMKISLLIKVGGLFSCAKRKGAPELVPPNGKKRVYMLMM
jgi:hypothetical protein